jgi:hypothetical protein
LSAPVFDLSRAALPGVLTTNALLRYPIATMPAGLAIQFKTQILWQYFQDPKTRLWIGVCDVLKLTVEAESWATLHESIIEAMTMLFKELLSTGDLPNFLAENGWQTLAPLPPATSRDVSFDVPLKTQRISPHDIEKAFHK